MSNNPILAGVVGWPIGHSLSPLIHQSWAARAGVNGYYVPIAAAPDYESFSAVIDSLRVIGFVGVNVTIPHKEHALRYADDISDAAAAAGAANMLSFDGDRAVADNSDIAGFRESLRSVLGDDARQAALVLGAGGAARAIILALKDAGVSDIRITNRTWEKADLLAQDYALTAIDWNNRDAAAGGADIVVNTTSLGMSGQPPLDFNLSAAPHDAVVADIIYSPLETDLLRAARKSGRPALGGLSMLMHQAAPGFRRWFGGEASVDDALEAALIAELKRRTAS